MRERDVSELTRSIGEDADPDSGRLEASKLRARFRTRPEMDRPAVVGEALEQRPPIAEPLIENRRRLDRSSGTSSSTCVPPRDVLEPVPPQRPCVRQHGIEIERYCLQALDARLALQTGER